MTKVIRNISESLNALVYDATLKLSEDDAENYQLKVTDIERLWLDESERLHLSKGAKRFASERLKSWDERADWELNLVKAASRPDSRSRCGADGMVLG